jgi:hypothetical protein
MKALPGDDEDEDEGRDEDGRDGFLWRTFFFSLLLCFFLLWVLFFFGFFVPLFSAIFFSVSPLPFLCLSSPLSFSRLQSFVFIGDMPGLFFAHGLPLDKHGWEGCVGVSLGFEYLSSILISPGHLSS